MLQIQNIVKALLLLLAIAPFCLAELTFDSPSGDTVWIWQKNTTGNFFPLQVTQESAQQHPMPDNVIVTLHRRTLFFWEKLVSAMPVESKLLLPQKKSVKSKGEIWGLQVMSGWRPVYKNKFKNEQPKMDSEHVCWNIPMDKIKEGTYFVQIWDTNDKLLARSKLFRVLKQVPRKIPEKVANLDVKFADGGRSIQVDLRQPFDRNEEMSIGVFTGNSTGKWRRGPKVLLKQLIPINFEGGLTGRASLNEVKVDNGVFLEISLKRGLRRYVLTRFTVMPEKKCRKGAWGNFCDFFSAVFREFAKVNFFKAFIGVFIVPGGLGNYLFSGSYHGLMDAAESGLSRNRKK